MNATTWLKRCKSYTAKWINDPVNREWNFQHARSQLTSRVAHTLREGLYLGSFVSTDLMLVQSWFGMLAASQLLSDDFEGWKSLQLSYLFENWRTRLPLGEQAIGRSKAQLEVVDHTLGFAHAIAIRDDAYVDIQGPVLLESLEGKSTRFRDWKERCFEQFVVGLYAMLRGQDIAPDPKLGPLFGPYRDVFDSWHDPISLSSVLCGLCDLHIEESNDMSKLGHIGAFSKAPYANFPVEMLAIRRVREDFGLPMPEIDHPLMQTMMAHPPAVMPEVHDDVLDQIIAKARQEGIAGDPW